METYIFYILRSLVSSLQFLFNHWFFPPLAFQTIADLQPFCLSLLSIRHNASNAKLKAFALSPTLVLISGATLSKTPTTLSSFENTSFEVCTVQSVTLHDHTMIINMHNMSESVCVCLHVCVTCACVCYVPVYSHLCL